MKYIARHLILFYIILSTTLSGQTLSKDSNKDPSIGVEQNIATLKQQNIELLNEVRNQSDTIKLLIGKTENPKLNLLKDIWVPIIFIFNFEPKVS
jgi:hypothetical protein